MIICAAYIVLSITRGILLEGSWKLLDELEDSGLKELAKKLPNTVLHSRANSTVKKYLGAFRRWKTWATSHKLVPLPAKPHEVAFYLQHLGEKTRSKSAAEEACNALSWAHASAGLASPSSNLFVKTVLEGLQRSYAKPVVKKELLTVDMLERIVDDAEKSGALSDLRLATACLLGFAGFLRFDELIRLRPCEIKFSEEMLAIKILGSKTDQLRQGDEVVISRTGSRTCPVAMLERYMARTATPHEDQRFLFRPIQKTKHCEELRGTGKISYTCLRDLFRKKLSSLGYNVKDFGLHRLRASGATAAANAEVPDRLFKRHGRWRSESAKDGYVKDNIESRLQVSQSLGL
ncbi:integrase/recombinase xerD homolog isoform X3 [Dysidea avara]